MKKNALIYYSEALLYNIAYLVANGAYLQTFMLECGIAERSVQFFAAAMQIIQISAMLLFSKRIENTKKIFSCYTLIRFLQLPLFSVLLILSIKTDLKINFQYGIIFIFAALFNISVAVKSILCYKLPYHIVSMEKYGILTSVSSGASAIAALIFSLFVSKLLSTTAFFSAFQKIIITAILSFLTSMLITTRYRAISGFREPRAEKNSSFNIFRYKQFSILIIPNILRGFCFGVFELAVTIGYHFDILDIRTASYLVVITTVSGIISSFLYTYISIKRIDGLTILVSSVIVALSLPLMLINNTSAVFLVFYTVGYLSLNLINNATPVAITKFVDYTKIGTYSAFRMILHTAGIALSGIFCIPCFNLFGGLISMIIFGLMQLISGLFYYFCIKSFSPGTAD